MEALQQTEVERHPVHNEQMSDYDTLSPISLSPISLSPYGRSTPPDPGFVTPRTPELEPVSPVSPYVGIALEEFMNPTQTLESNTNKSSTKKQELPFGLETVSILAHLATFGVLGVLIRYGLEKLFDDVGHVTSGHTALFHDLPANMLGSFFMGWVGFVMKKDIAHFSESLAVGLSTGLMGSITTFSSWIVKLIIVMTKGSWLIGFCGILIGMMLSMASLVVGMDTAQGLRGVIVSHVGPKVAADNASRKMKSFIFFMSTSVLLWTLFVVLAVLDSDVLERRTLWLACVFSPPGVWLRWLLSKRNGRGVYKRLLWFPWGTLSANLLACIIGFTLSVVLLATGNYASKLWIGAVQLGTLGCLSTVSTLVGEVYNFRKAGKISRAYVYTFVSLLSACILGIVFYSSIVWARNYRVVI